MEMGTLPGFSAERSLYVNVGCYRTTSHYELSRPSIHLSDNGSDCDCTETPCSATADCCCSPCTDPSGGSPCAQLPGSVCMLRSDGTLAGCCLGTPCDDTGGNLYCAPTGSVCCGDGPCEEPNYCCAGNCIPQTADNCTACGNPCADNETCCLSATREAFCTDTAADSQNCGTCGAECRPGRSACPLAIAFFFRVDAILLMGYASASCGCSTICGRARRQRRPLTIRDPRLSQFACCHQDCSPHPGDAFDGSFG
jgi:hypothetical protein